MAAVVLWFKIPCIIVIRCVNRSDRDLFGRPSAATANLTSNFTQKQSIREVYDEKSRAPPRYCSIFLKIEQAETVWLGFSVAWAVSSKLDVFSVQVFTYFLREEVELNVEATTPLRPPPLLDRY